jgi:hypothetical protein
MLELACTGQIYLPTIIFMSSVRALRGKSDWLPAALQPDVHHPANRGFCLSLLRTTSKQLSAFLKKHAAAVKTGYGARVPHAGRLANIHPAKVKKRPGGARSFLSRFIPRQFQCFLPALPRWKQVDQFGRTAGFFWHQSFVKLPAAPARC